MSNKKLRKKLRAKEKLVDILAGQTGVLLSRQAILYDRLEEARQRVWELEEQLAGLDRINGAIDDAFQEDGD